MYRYEPMYTSLCVAKVLQCCKYVAQMLHETPLKTSFKIVSKTS